MTIYQTQRSNTIFLAPPTLLTLACMIDLQKKWFCKPMIIALSRGIHLRSIWMEQFAQKQKILIYPPIFIFRGLLTPKKIAMSHAVFYYWVKPEKTIKEGTKPGTMDLSTFIFLQLLFKALNFSCTRLKYWLPNLGVTWDCSWDYPFWIFHSR